MFTPSPHSHASRPLMDKNQFELCKRYIERHCILKENQYEDMVAWDRCPYMSLKHCQSCSYRINMLCRHLCMYINIYRIARKHKTKIQVLIESKHVITCTHTHFLVHTNTHTHTHNQTLSHPILWKQHESAWLNTYWQGLLICSSHAMSSCSHFPALY